MHTNTGLRVAAVLIAALSNFTVGTASAVTMPARADGSYMVPATEDMEAVTMPVSRASVEVRDGVTTLEYELPAEMDGASARSVHASGSLNGGAGTLVGMDEGETMQVTATCSVLGNATECHMTYFAIQADGTPSATPKIVLDEAASEEFQLARYATDPAALDKFRSARASLMHQSIGILRVTEYTSNARR